MCMGKSKSTAAPAPAPPTTFQPMPPNADYSNVSQRQAAVASSTNSQVSQGSSGLGSELGSASNV